MASLTENLKDDALMVDILTSKYKTAVSAYLAGAADKRTHADNEGDGLFAAIEKRIRASGILTDLNETVVSYLKYKSKTDEETIAYLLNLRYPTSISKTV
jgi:hypothetical protein